MRTRNLKIVLKAKTLPLIAFRLCLLWMDIQVRIVRNMSFEIKPNTLPVLYLFSSLLLWMENIVRIVRSRHVNWNNFVFWFVLALSPVKGHYNFFWKLWNSPWNTALYFLNEARLWRMSNSKWGYLMLIYRPNKEYIQECISIWKNLHHLQPKFQWKQWLTIHVGTKFSYW